MKKNLFAAICILPALYCTISCTQLGHHNINITMSESGHYYKMVAYYNKSRSLEVDKYMDKHFGKASNMSFVNTRIDGDIAMNDGTNFYINKKAGYLKITFDKNKNSLHAYKEVKAFGNDLKLAVQQ